MLNNMNLSMINYISIKDILLRRVSASSKYILSKIKKDEDKETFIFISNQLQDLIKNEGNLENSFTNLKKKMTKFENILDVSRHEPKGILSLLDRTKKYERIAIDNVIDIIDKTEARFLKGNQ
jgi:hypothetical protein